MTKAKKPTAASKAKAKPAKKFKKTDFFKKPKNKIIKLNLKQLHELETSWFLYGFAACALIAYLIYEFAGEPAAENIVEIERQVIEPTAPAQPIEQPQQSMVDGIFVASEKIIYAQKTIKSGDTFIEAIQETGVGYNQANDFIKALKNDFPPRKLRVGHELEIGYTEEEILNENGEPEKRNDLRSVKVVLDRLNSITVRKLDEKNYEIEKLTKATRPELVRKGGIIKNSLYQTAVDLGIPDKIIINMIDAYSYDVDFQRDIWGGEYFEVVYENLKIDNGEIVDYGDIIFANLQISKKDIPIFLYEDSKGSTEFFHADGNSVRKSLLKTPVPGARISSKYGMRKHPILGYNKMHKGMDFAAPTGTPIYAAGDGRVDFVGRRGGYGKYIRLRHNGTYSTAYAHLHKYARGMKKGRKVKQGQVIGYVGSTGRSTGPHLHYEILKNGKQVNPARQKFPNKRKLKGNEFKRFEKAMADIKDTVDSVELRHNMTSNVLAE